MVFESLAINTLYGQTNSKNMSSSNQTDSIDSTQEMKRIENSRRIPKISQL